jgi:hypothetical protein
VCLFNAISVALFGHENASSEIRLKTFFEMSDHAMFYERIWINGTKWEGRQNELTPKSPDLINDISWRDLEQRGLNVVLRILMQASAPEPEETIAYSETSDPCVLSSPNESHVNESHDSNPKSHVTQDDIVSPVQNISL